MKMDKIYHLRSGMAPKGPKKKALLKRYQMKDIPGDTSFLEMLDILNRQLISER